MIRKMATVSINGLMALIIKAIFRKIKSTVLERQNIKMERWQFYNGLKGKV